MNAERRNGPNIISAIEIFAGLWLGLASAAGANLFGLGASALLIGDGLSGGQLVGKLLPPHN